MLFYDLLLSFIAASVSRLVGHEGGWEGRGHTEAFSTQNSRRAREYGASYFHGLLVCSVVKSWCFGGRELGIAFLPLEVTVLGRDFENKGRMTDCRR